MSLKDRQAEIVSFFNKERDKLVWYIRKQMVNVSEMDVEDVIQDVMLNLFNKADITNHVENLAAYIYRSIYNRIIDQLRKGKKTVSLDEMIDHSGEKVFYDRFYDPGYDIHQEFARNELHQKLFTAIDSLEPKQRAVWIATEMEGYSFKELATLWNEPIGTLLSRKHRAIQALQAALQEFRPAGEDVGNWK